MDASSEFVMARRNVADTLDWLQRELLLKVRESLNQSNMRARLGLYGGEVIPTNERNLTDTRNRVSLIYEYLFADTLTEFLGGADANEFCAYVVANRFPDLEVRDRQGNRGLRLEVKCLQTTAEEKAANFSTLLKDIHPTGDYLVVFLWEWGWDSAEVHWDRAPLVRDIFVFNAYTLAQLRDWYWLNRPGNKQGEAYQGYDLRGAITANQGDYKEEEGNYGKLLRIWDKDFTPRPQLDDIAKRTEADYIRFREAALSSGFESLSRTILQSVVDEHEIQPLEVDQKLVGYRRGRHWFVLNSKIDVKSLIQAMKQEGALDVVRFSDKYVWSHCRLAGQRLKSLTTGQKPKQLGSYLTTQYLTNLGED